MSQPARYLAFAFANADLLLEIEPSGTIAFAVGAQGGLNGNQPLNGSSCAQLFEPRDGARFSSMIQGLPQGGRVGPVRLKLAGGRDVEVALCRLPQNGNHISCTFSYSGPRANFGTGGKDPQSGLADQETFISTAAERSGDTDYLTVVRIAGLDATSRENDSVFARIGQAIGQSAAKVAGRISQTC